MIESESEYVFKPPVEGLSLIRILIRIIYTSQFFSIIA